MTTIYRLRKEKDEEKLQRMVQEEAVKFLWNQVKILSLMLFKRTLYSEKLKLSRKYIEKKCILHILI